MQLSESDYTVAPELMGGLNGKKIANVLNNFSMYFSRVPMVGPTGKKSIPNTAYYKIWAKEGRYWDKPYKALGENKHHPHTDKRQNQTTCQFFAEIAKVVKEERLTMKEVATAATLFHLSQAISFANFEEWAPILVRVYIALRRKGYNRQDLAG